MQLVIIVMCIKFKRRLLKQFTLYIKSIVTIFKCWCTFKQNYKQAAETTICQASVLGNMWTRTLICKQMSENVGIIGGFKKHNIAVRHTHTTTHCTV